MAGPLAAIFEPAAIAIVGASADPTKRGYQALRRLLADEFPGPIYPIHPRETEILGVKAFPSVAAVEGDIDLALICTPAATVPALLDECGAKGVRGAVVLAAGFGETGADGARLEAESVAAARRHGIRIVGPNASGFFNLHCAMNLVGFAGVRPGGLGIVSQSGNMALSIATEGQAGGAVGFSVYAGVGNQADLGFSDYLAHLGADPETAVPILYVEGFKHGRRFLETARAVTQQKPVVLYKTGRTEAGRTAALSHTGALAGSYELTAGVLRQAGVTLVRRSDLLVPVAEALSLLPKPNGNRVAVLADGGGHGAITSDALIEAGLSLATLGEDTRARLAALLPAAAALGNPVDMAGGPDGNPAVFADCARLLLEDAAVDALLIIGLFGGYGLRFAESLAPIEQDTARRLGGMMAEYGKPVMLQSLYHPLHPAPLIQLREAGVPVHGSIETAVACLAAAGQHAAATRRNAAPLRAPAAPNPDSAAVVAAARQAGRTALLEPEAKALLAGYGIPVGSEILVRAPEQLDEAVAALGGGPLAMKIVSPDILHKTEAGCVRLGLSGAESAHAAYREIVANARAYNAGAVIEGVLLARMAPKGVEVIIGVVQDRDFGPVMMFGLGGIFVEVLEDVAFRALPLGEADAYEMLDEIKGRKLLEGARGAAAVDRAALVSLMLGVSDAVAAHPEIAELDLNPVIATGDGCHVVDARVILTAPGA